MKKFLLVLSLLFLSVLSQACNHPRPEGYPAFTFWRLVDYDQDDFEWICTDCSKKRFPVYLTLEHDEFCLVCANNHFKGVKCANPGCKKSLVKISETCSSCGDQQETSIDRKPLLCCSNNQTGIVWLCLKCFYKYPYEARCPSCCLFGKENPEENKFPIAYHLVRFGIIAGSIYLASNLIKTYGVSWAINN